MDKVRLFLTELSARIFVSGQCFVFFCVEVLRPSQSNEA